MSPISASDLPPEVRARLGLQTVGKPRTTRRVGPHEPHAGWRCHTCSEPVASIAAMDRHSDAFGHHRFDCVIEAVS